MLRPLYISYSSGILHMGRHGLRMTIPHGLKDRRHLEKGGCLSSYESTQIPQTLQTPVQRRTKQSVSMLRPNISSWPITPITQNCRVYILDANNKSDSSCQAQFIHSQAMRILMGTGNRDTTHLALCKAFSRHDH